MDFLTVGCVDIFLLLTFSGAVLDTLSLQDLNVHNTGHKKYNSDLDVDKTILSDISSNQCNALMRFSLFCKTCSLFLLYDGNCVGSCLGLDG